MLRNQNMCRSQRQRGVRRRSAAARLQRLGSNPTGGMDVCCECCVLSGRGLCDGLITRPEEPYRPWCVTVCDLETSWKKRPWPTGDCRAKNKQTKLKYVGTVNNVTRIHLFLSNGPSCPTLNCKH